MIRLGGWALNVIALALVYQSRALASDTLVKAGDPSAAARRDFIVKRVRFGTAPNPDEFNRRLNGMPSFSQQLGDQNLTISRENEQGCRRYLLAFKRTSTQIVRLMQRIDRAVKSEPKLLSANARELYRQYPLEVARLQISTTLLSMLNGLAQADSEAGFGILDPERSKQVCKVHDRVGWKAAMNRYTDTQLHATFALIGAPGLLQMGVMNDALARETVSVETSERWRWWSAFTIETAVSIALWKGVPQILRLIRPTLAAANVPTVFAARVLALSGEILTIKEIEDGLLFVEHGLLKRRSHSIEWTDLLNEVESLLDAPMRSPRLYGQAITQVYANMSLQMEAILSVNENNTPTSIRVSGPR